jgi:ribosomal-protein-alanine N-acetyltransferase
LLDHVLGRAMMAGSSEIFLEVRPSNPVAKALYIKSGFEQVGQRPDYYAAGDGREDAIIMRLSL